MRVLLIGKIWPEPTSSAAGTRTLDVLRALKLADWETHFACAAQKSEHSADFASTLDVTTHCIELNNTSFDKWVAGLAPDIIIFDRYMTEEQFGWRVEKALPDALRVIDTSDLHFLREARQQACKSGKPLDLQNDIALREVAAIIRSDLSLIISEFEYELLLERFPISPESIAYWPFCLRSPPPTRKSFSARQDFIMIGSFLHEPNWDSVLWCHQEIWPRIQKRIPNASLKVFGSYPPPKAQQLHSPKTGFLLCGRANDASEVMENARVNLAPLRFGAGLKGKLADAFIAGTPSVATPIAAEGMTGNLPWGSEITADPETFAAEAIRLFQEENAWRNAQACGDRIAAERFSESHWLTQLPAILSHARECLFENRKANFVGQLLRHHHQRSTEFMSRWIEAKNK